jgi:uncharacterized membrane protein
VCANPVNRRPARLESHSLFAHAAQVAQECPVTRYRLEFAGTALDRLPATRAPGIPDFIRGCLADFKRTIERGEQASALRLLLSSHTTAAAVFMGVERASTLEIALRGRRSDEVETACANLFLAALSLSHEPVAQAVQKISIFGPDVHQVHRRTETGEVIMLAAKGTPTGPCPFLSIGATFDDRDQGISVGGHWLGHSTFHLELKRPQIFASLNFDTISRLRSDSPPSPGRTRPSL